MAANQRAVAATARRLARGNYGLTVDDFLQECALGELLGRQAGKWVMLDAIRHSSPGFKSGGRMVGLCEPVKRYRSLIVASHESKLIAKIDADKLLSGLTGKQLEAVRLVYESGCTFEEVAVIIGKPRTAVTALMFRALHRMRKAAA